MSIRSLFAVTATALCPMFAGAAVRLPAIFTDHLVLQQKQANPVWGWDDPGAKVTVRFAGQEKSATAGADGRWQVKLDPLDASAEPRLIEVAGSTKAAIKDVLVGEVWVGSGQSNMQWSMSNTWDADLERLVATHPNLRLITVPMRGTQTLETDFQGAWTPCTPDDAAKFSAVLYFYGKLLHQALGVPVGLIHCSWGGSACEAWVPRTEIEKDDRFAKLMASWRDREAKWDEATAKEQHAKAMEAWKQKADQAKQAGKPVPPAPRYDNAMGGNQRPGNLWAGMAHAIAGYGIRGTIWYQGESNAGRAAQYRDLFPFMISCWRKAWAQGDFPFYWVQLADFQAERPEPAESGWAELREAQTLTLDKLPATGQAVIIDLGEASDIHPRNKRDVAERLARLALADAGVKIPRNSPRFESLKIEGKQAVVRFREIGGGLRAVDNKDLLGFTLCGPDKRWLPATATLRGKDTIIVQHPEVPQPVAVRYAWADNPVCNVYSAEGLPLTPFRSDDFPMITAEKTP